MKCKHLKNYYSHTKLTIHLLKTYKIKLITQLKTNLIKLKVLSTHYTLCLHFSSQCVKQTDHYYKIFY